MAEKAKKVSKDSGKIVKVKTGIDGLDKALNGGIPHGNVVLVSGGAGTGKSTLALQYLINGITKFDEKGLYISTEQSREEIAKTAASFNWDIDKLEQENKLKIAYFDVVETDNFLEKIYELYTSFMPERVVIDSLTTLSDSLLVSGAKEGKDYSLVKVAETVSPVPRSERIVTKNLLYHLMKKLRLFDSTILLTSELLEGEKGLSADQISEFICDGVITLHHLTLGGGTSRNLVIRKMRYTRHTDESLNLLFDSKGVKLIEEESI